MTSHIATTLKIAADLKRRVVAAAKVADKSPHAFMLEAIEHQDSTRRTAPSVCRRCGGGTFRGTYQRRGLRIGRMCIVILADRVRGERAQRPKVRTWRK